MKRRILIAHARDSTHVQTHFDYLRAFGEHLDHVVEYLHVTDEAITPSDLEAYDVVIHNYCARLCYEGYVSPSYRSALRAFKGLKILGLQDEYEGTGIVRDAIRELGFDYVLTCVPQESVEYVYPTAAFPDVRFVTVLTGYVPADFVSAPRPVTPLAERPVVIGYRGRDLGADFGRLGFLKAEIGRRMRAICEQRGVRHDIAIDEASRIYGPAWLDFIGKCRVMLGSESGSNVFDFDGSLEQKQRAFADAHDGRRPTYEEFRPHIDELEAKIDMGQVSPRVFECAVMRTPMVLFRGRYSDVVSPDRHYIPLDLDFGNVDEVLERIADIPALTRMTERVYEDVVASGSFSYRAFMSDVSDLIREGLERKGRSRARSEPVRPEVEKSRRFLIEMPQPTIKADTGLVTTKIIAARRRLLGLEWNEARTMVAYDEAANAAEEQITTAERNLRPVEMDRVRREIEAMRQLVAQLRSATEAANASLEDDMNGFRSMPPDEARTLLERIESRLHAVTDGIARMNAQYAAVDAAATFALALGQPEKVFEAERRTATAYLDTCSWVEGQLRLLQRLTPQQKECLPPALEEFRELLNGIQSSAASFAADLRVKLEAISESEREIRDRQGLAALVAARHETVKANIELMNCDYNILLANLQPDLALAAAIDQHAKMVESEEKTIAAYRDACAWVEDQLRRIRWLPRQKRERLRTIRRMLDEIRELLGKMKSSATSFAADLGVKLEALSESENSDRQSLAALVVARNEVIAANIELVDRDYNVLFAALAEVKEYWEATPVGKLFTLASLAARAVKKTARRSFPANPKPGTELR